MTEKIKIVKKLLQIKRTELQMLKPLVKTESVRSRINYIRGRIKSSHAWISRVTI